jgi:hypothetical protein
MFDKDKTCYYNFQKYKVNDVSTIEEFCNKYYKPDRFKNRGQEYMDCVIKSDYKDMENYGYVIISHHDSITGEVVAFYGNEIAQNDEYKYTLSSTGESSKKYGKCEVCGEHVSEVFLQSETKHYKFEHDGQIYEGWTHNKCNSYFGHKECLLSKRR